MALVGKLLINPPDSLVREGCSSVTIQIPQMQERALWFLLNVALLAAEVSQRVLGLCIHNA